MQTEGIGVDSRTATEEEKRELITHEEDLFTKLVEHSGSMKSLIQQIAETIEQRINLLDLDFGIEHISSYITKKLRERHLSGIAHHVPDYLPDKYKNQNMIRLRNLNNKLEVALCPPLGGKPLEQYSITEIEFEIEMLKHTDNDADKIVMLLNNRKEDLYREALNRGLTEIAGDKIRYPITSKDYRYEIPEYFGLTELNEEVVKQGNRWIRALTKFFNEKYPQRPAVVRQKAWSYANSIRTVANLYETINEDKWSGDKSFWFERQFWSIIQSKHDSGNSTMFPTTLCANCSKDVDENPKDCVRMKHWRPSPTGYLCEQCGGTEPLLRENTREQVGDKEANVYRDAQDVLNYMKEYPDVFIDYVERFKSPEVYARKSAIHGEFSDSAISGTDKIVIPKKKTTH